MVNEQALIGAEEIAEFLRLPKSSVYKKIPALREAGVVFRRASGRPRRWRVYTFPSLLIAYLQVYNREMRKRGIGGVPRGKPTG